VELEGVPLNAPGLQSPHEWKHWLLHFADALPATQVCLFHKLTGHKLICHYRQVFSMISLALQRQDSFCFQSRRAQPSSLSLRAYCPHHVVGHGDHHPISGIPQWSHASPSHHPLSALDHIPTSWDNNLADILALAHLELTVCLICQGHEYIAAFMGQGYTKAHAIHKDMMLTLTLMEILHTHSVKAHFT
jgi:hypothetical protein